MGIEVVVSVVNTQYVVFLIIRKGAASESEKGIRMSVSFLVVVVGETTKVGVAVSQQFEAQ